MNRFEMTQRGPRQPRALTQAALAMAASLMAVLLTGCGAIPAPSTSRAPLVPPEITAAAIGQHITALDEIAMAHDGLRTAGTAGYTASVEYVASELEAMGYTVSTPSLEMMLFNELPGATLEIEGGDSFMGGPDFRAMIYSGGGDVTARVTTVGFRNSHGGIGSRGCEASDFEDFPDGAIALVAPGADCFRRQVVMNADAAGAAALIAANPLWPRGEARRPTLLGPGIEIPALAATQPLSAALRRAAADSREVHIRVDVQLTPATVQNVLAETPGGDAGRVAMLGGHLDSVHDGPGINDNGSGVAALLEIARASAGGVEGGRLRFAFWAAEEYGLYGSRAYVQSLSETDRQSIVSYLNLDMLGSLNAVPFVYDGRAAAPGSAEIADFLVTTLDSAGIGSELIDVGGASDHAPFNDAGIPVGGIFSGATELKTSEQADEFGGTAGAAMDACYHLACDTAENVDAVRTAAFAEVAATAALALARGDLLP